MNTVRNIALSLLFMMVLPAHSVIKIIGGEVPEEKNPSFYNTVALVKTDGGKAFCTGSLASRNIVVTAKHCLMEINKSEFKIFFGPSSLRPSEGVFREIESLEVFRPLDWKMTFPNLDIAWIKLKKDAPIGYRPIPILTDHKKLTAGMRVLLAGYGNKRIDGSVKTGDKFFITSKFKSFHHNSRFNNILLFEGDEGKGSCHGDSGGPAYIQIKNDFGQLEWRLIGVTNGIDVVMTPKAMKRTGDEDFPHIVSCDKNQTIYSFIGGYGSWIERSSGEILEKDGYFSLEQDYEKKPSESLMEWCQSLDIGSSSWNFLKVLLDKKVDSIAQNSGLSFYQDCSQVVSYLEKIEAIEIDGSTLSDPHLSTANLKLLPNLREVKIKAIDSSLLDLNFSGLNLKKLTLNLVNLKQLSELKLSNSRIEFLDLSSNPLNSLVSNELGMTGLKSLNISKTEVVLLSDLNGLILEEFLCHDCSDQINFNGFQLSSLKKLSLTQLPNVQSLDFTKMIALEELNLTSVEIKSINLKNSKSLKSLSIANSDTLNNVDTTSKSFEKIVIRNNSQLDFSFLTEGFKELRYLDVSGMGLESIDWLTLQKFPRLENLVASSNPITSVAPLGDFTRLKSVRLFGTSIHKKEVELNEKSCPVLSRSVVLNTYCSRVRKKK